MISNYLKIVIRKFFRNKDFTILNVLGLSIGIAGAIITAQYVVYELSYDKFFSKSDDIYLLRHDKYQDGDLVFKSARTYFAVAPTIKKDFPEVEEAVRLYNYGNQLVSFGDKKFNEKTIYLATENFFDVFDIPLIKGPDNPKIDDPLSIYISEKMAKKYFGDQDPIGEILGLKYMSYPKAKYKIVGVFEDIPDNSHLKIEFLTTYSNYFKGMWSDDESLWRGGYFYTYVLLNENADALALEDKLKDFIGNYKSEPGAEEFLGLDNITDIHLGETLRSEMKPVGSKAIVYALMIISVFILMIAWINYINLSTAKSIERSREIGIRKAIGASKLQLIRQFFTESVMLIIISMVASSVVYAVIRLGMRNFVESSIDLSSTTFSWFWIVLIGIFLAGNFLSSIYPALVLSSLRPVTALRGVLQRSVFGFKIRKVLVVFQFAAASLLCIGTYTVYTQLQFMKNQDLGIEVEQVAVIKAPNLFNGDPEFVTNSKTFKTEVLRDPSVLSLSNTGAVPGSETWKTSGFIRKSGDAQTKNADTYSLVWVDYSFLDTYELDLAAGRFFNPKYETANQERTINKVVLNEKAVQMMGFEDVDSAIGELLNYSSKQYEIIGVVKNYHQRSLKHEYDPMVYFLMLQNNYYYSLKLKGQDNAKTMESVGLKFDQAFGGYPFEYFFLEEFFDRQYTADQTLGQVLGLFSFLAIIVACMGIFGLSSIIASQRKKEIGIRKVMGGDLLGIIRMLLKEHLILALMANLVVWPVAYFLISRWLENYAFHISLNGNLVLIPLLLIVMVSLVSVSYYILKAAKYNPVDIIRNDN